MCNVTHQRYRLRYSCNARARAAGAGLRYAKNYSNAKRLVTQFVTLFFGPNA